MAAIVKPIDAKSVHQIQSGQVIVDLCSVVKELVENSLDAGANAVEVRLKNNGLDEIEVQDNGDGIAPINYESVALKHHTSKLSNYDDLSTLQTFGFRGEALSSLCALSTFTVITAQADQAPKGNRLEFEVSGKLKSTSVVACSKGTTVSVQNLFEKLPVRRKELSKNIKREYGKVVGLLHAYACISTEVKFTVKNAMPKAKSMTVFATKSNFTTRENIANVYGAKTLSALVALDLKLDLPQTAPMNSLGESDTTQVSVQGHISRPVFGEGRQTPDRQMFFVNGRPCGLPQIAKAINEVYKSFNVSQSPFIFADLRMDTNAYDVNVSPDKRTIFLHNATALIESLKASLTELFDQQDQTVPQSSIKAAKLPYFKQLNIQRQPTTSPSQRSASANSTDDVDSHVLDAELEDSPQHNQATAVNNLLHDHFRNLASTREDPDTPKTEKELKRLAKDKARRALKLAEDIHKHTEKAGGICEFDDIRELNEQVSVENVMTTTSKNQDVHVRDFNARMAEQQIKKAQNIRDDRETLSIAEPQIVSTSPIRQTDPPGIVQNAFDRMRPRRMQPEVATITIGDRVVTRVIGSHIPDSDALISQRRLTSPRKNSKTKLPGVFAQGLQRFNAHGIPEELATYTQTAASSGGDEDEEQEVSVDGPHNETSDRDINDGGVLRAKRASNSAAVDINDGNDDEDEEQQRIAEEQRVADLIHKAERASAQQAHHVEKRASQVLKTGRAKDLIVSVGIDVEIDMEELRSVSKAYHYNSCISQHNSQTQQDAIEMSAESAEERLSLTVSKSDFMGMHIVGQFNLGFILAVRRKTSTGTALTGSSFDELFIIDQHASDEKYNFEKLQAETVVGNQRMVHPALLDLTAVEEEIVMDNAMALEKNGFIVIVDESGNAEIGRRCQLVSLPLSKEVVFGTKDLDELIHLLAESPMLNDSSPVPRPSKVRKMFAMRACRSSIMIGKTLSHKQMSSILQHMGSIDKPWNCPHGRPTMRHLASLDTLEASLWEEGDGVYPGQDFQAPGPKSALQTWRNYTGIY